MSLSVCCLTAEPVSRVKAVLEPLRGIADEIIVVLDSRTRGSQQSLDGLVDRLLTVDYSPPFERYLDWLHSLCRGRWILRLDGDEIPTPEFVSELQAVLPRDDVLQGHLLRRWLTTPDAYLASGPLRVDYQLRLVRNDAALLRFAGALHTSVHPVVPAYYFEHPIYHASHVLLDEQQRAAKVAHYGSSPHREHDVADAEHFLPERTLAEPIVEGVPGSHRPWIHAALQRHDDTMATQGVDTVDQHVVDERWARRPWSAADCSVSLSVDAGPGGLAPGQHSLWRVLVRNTSQRPFLSVPTLAVPRLSYRARRLGAEEWLAEGPRVHMPHDLRPGQSAVVPLPVALPETAVGDIEVVVDLVLDGVRWFDHAVAVVVQARPASHA